MTDATNFPFMDTIAGYVVDYDGGRGVFVLETADGRRSWTGGDA